MALQQNHSLPLLQLIDGISGLSLRGSVADAAIHTEDTKSKMDCRVTPSASLAMTKPKTLNITGITQDSRKVKPGYLFVAIKGVVSDGADFIPMAIENGAVAVLCDMSLRGGVADAAIHATESKSEMNCHIGLTFPRNDIVFIKHQNPKLALAHIAANFYSAQPEVIAAITGTNGKTSTAYFCTQIWQLLDKKSASIGTIGIATGDGLAYGATASMTTPDPVKLHEILANLSEDGVTHLAMEASSHGLDQYRLDGVRVRAAAFTNITRDHLDYHGTFEKYLAAKLRLFEIMQDGVAVINADLPESSQIIELCEEKNHKVLSVGKNGGYIILNDVTRTSNGQQIAFEVAGKLYNVNTHLIGEFQAYNLLTALALVAACGANLDEAVAVLAQVQAVPGRMQGVYSLSRLRGRVREGGKIKPPSLESTPLPTSPRTREEEQTFARIYVDYAHTPDALEKALQVLRPYASGKLWVVFGCGGDRDKGKRPQMGAVAARLADVLVVTDDNPRTENADIIRKEIIAVCPDAHEIGDRADAIKYAITNMGQEDILLIAGKGHEKTQIIGDKKLAFDDVEVVRRELA